MSSIQRPTRRLSARNHQKDDATVYSNQEQGNRNAKTTVGASDTVAAQAATARNEKKRKMDYDEEDDGFQFKRVKKKPPPRKQTEKGRDGSPPQGAAPIPQPVGDRTQSAKNEETKRKPLQQKDRTSFPPPVPKEDPPRRRSKRLSKDNEQQDRNPVEKSERREETKKRKYNVKDPPKLSPEKKVDEPPPPKRQEHPQEDSASTEQQVHASTKIALPFADTPVIKRNKAMREGKAGKGERRSSLGMRGRRASSLIDSGNSSGEHFQLSSQHLLTLHEALPHPELDVSDYYKHIESEGLPEPRRMKQLLIWCAERALDEKPLGAGFGEASAIQAARVIEEELLKELANRSDLSDWFGREEVPVPSEPLPERPNPKNTQNIEKIAELEEQIKRLRSEKEALENLLRPPKIPSLHELDVPTSPSQADQLARTLLDEADATALDSIAPQVSPTTDQISRRLGDILESMGPTVDKFADGIHRIAQYRTAADGVAGRALAMCAEKLTRREKEGTKKALGVRMGTSPPRDLGGVLRSLSRADR
ncbi:hypothetical protein AYO20_09832 [Fonsecaea nubica]|uniref:Kinetochore protein mis13 n=1 Tax=Fonsecaea nubica TaxID=856822 RepID=A0A178CCZ4_9EURO|nr:hypothetical protein AYO20_09832 [Fonsecaea nubica]OAL27234.1 hypothetical protein AYO20_09832 [Fonsecaea nubica]